MGRRHHDSPGCLGSAFLQQGAGVGGGRQRDAALSDHVDWPSLLDAILATGAGEVWVTHGFTEPVVRWLGEQGVEARAVQTRFEGERDDEASDAGGDGGTGGSGKPPEEELVS